MSIEDSNSLEHGGVKLGKLIENKLKFDKVS